MRVSNRIIPPSEGLRLRVHGALQQAPGVVVVAVGELGEEAWTSADPSPHVIIVIITPGPPTKSFPIKSP